MAGGGSPNPAGRPSMPAEVKEILAEATPKAARRLIELMDSDDERVALVACRELLDRTLGKAPATIEAAAETERLQAYGEEVRVAVLKCLEAKHARIDAGLDDDDD